MAITRFFGKYSFLSNFYHTVVQLNGVDYPSVENAYQAAKLEPQYREVFCRCSAGDAKTYGRRAGLRPDWEQVKLSIMEDLLRQKFTLGTRLASKLLETGTQELIEGNYWGDDFWGVCTSKGQNHLGKLLMKIRTELALK